MKKHLTNEQLKKLLKYISPEELKFQEKHWGKVPYIYWERVNMWYNFLKRYFLNYEFDHFILSIILLEMQSFSTLNTRNYNKKFKTDQISDKGATGLLESLELFKTNFMNIESINIKVRVLHHLSTENVPKTIDDLTSKDSMIKNYKIEGKEVIIELFRLINNHRDVFQKIYDMEKRYDGKTAQIIIKDKPKIYLRKRFSPILYMYLKEHLPYYTHNRLCTIGGILLYKMDLIPYSMSDLSENKKYKDYIRKNFERMLYSDFK